MCCSYNLSLWREQPRVVFDNHIFYCYGLTQTFVWYLLDIFNKQWFCASALLNQLPQITLSFVFFKQLFRYTCWWKSVTLQDCIWTGSLVGWLLLSLFSELLYEFLNFLKIKSLEIWQNTFYQVLVSLNVNGSGGYKVYVPVP